MFQELYGYSLRLACRTAPEKDKIQRHDDDPLPEKSTKVLWPREE